MCVGGMSDEIRRFRERLQVLSDATCAFAEAATDHDELIGTVARRVSEVMGDLCGVWLATEDGLWITLAGVHDPTPSVVAQVRARSHAPAKTREFPLAARVLEAREAVFVPDLGEPGAALDADSHRRLGGVDVRSLLAVPLRAHRRATGVLCLARWQPGRPPYDEDDWDFVQSLADHAALAIANAALVRSLQSELDERRRAEAALARTEEQLRQAQKMEAVGRLAGGVAHGFNNMLSVVLSYADLILADLGPDDPLRADVGEIRRAGEQASDLTRQLLAFSRRQVMRPRPVDLNQVVGGAEAMLRSVVGADVDLALSLAPGLWAVRADRGQVEVVLMNLAANAHDAMPLGGRLTIETRNVELGEDYAREELGASPGPYVMLSMADTGHGMDRETLDRIFEPFFTTKSRGRGAGLGLSTVFGVVKQSGGHIRVFSEPGLGTTFRIYLPRTEAPPAAASLPAVPVVADGGTMTVLLVEDDPQVRAVVRGILQRGGHRVLEADSPADAIEIAERQGGEIHLLLTDVVMPRMSGPQLAERIGARHPAMRVLFMSGYATDSVTQHGHARPDAAFLEKPITPESLARKLRELVGM